MKTINIVKIGGHLINDAQLLSDFLKRFAALPSPKLLVHGGGAAATELAKKLGVPVKMTQGRRITDKDTLAIITMVYAGGINKNIVADLQKEGCNAMGLSGADANSIEAVKRPVGAINFGYVGDIIKVNTRAIEALLASEITPVFCAITHDKKGQLLNTNADTIASELAIALSGKFQVVLHYCFEKKGVLQDLNDDESLIEHINSKLFKELVDQNIISDGMLPKLTNCFHALNNKVSAVHIGTSDMLFDMNAKYTTLEL